MRGLRKPTVIIRAHFCHMCLSCGSNGGSWVFLASEVRALQSKGMGTRVCWVMEFGEGELLGGGERLGAWYKTRTESPKGTISIWGEAEAEGVPLRWFIQRQGVEMETHEL